MAKTYVTFGQTHTHSVNGKTFDKDCIAVINAPTASEGRELAMNTFGRTFGTTYFEDEFNWEEMQQYFPRGLMKVN